MKTSRPGRTALILIPLIATILTLAAPGAPAGAHSGHSNILVGRGSLSDLSPSTTDPTDGTSAIATRTTRGGSSTFAVLLWGLDRPSAGRMLGAHVHVGPCVAGNGGAAGPHYNTTGGTTINTDTEVWLDFTVGWSGLAIAVAKVPFVIPTGGAQSIVVHAMPTATNGTAGARLACLPIAL